MCPTDFQSIAGECLFLHTLNNTGDLLKFCQIVGKNRVVLFWLAFPKRLVGWSVMSYLTDHSLPMH